MIEIPTLLKKEIDCLNQMKSRGISCSNQLTRIEILEGGDVVKAFLENQGLSIEWIEKEEGMLLQPPENGRNFSPHCVNTINGVLRGFDYTMLRNSAGQTVFLCLFKINRRLER